MNWSHFEIFSGGYDIAAACCYILYQLVFLVWPIVYIKENALPPGSSIIVTAEQVSLSLLSLSPSLSLIESLRDKNMMRDSYIKLILNACMLFACAYRSSICFFYFIF